jgi:peptide/nickel transport system permease protein
MSNTPPLAGIGLAPPARLGKRLPSRPVVLMLILILLAVAGPYLAPYNPNDQLDVLLLKNQPPSLHHPFGTDAASRDVLSRVLAGAQVSLTFAAGAVALSLCLGTLYGALAAFTGGVTERVLMRALDIAMALPRLLLLLTITALWHRLSLLALVLLIGGSGWFDIARLVRGELGAFLTRDFVLAARALGVKPWRLLTHHAVPHLLPTLVVTGTLSIAQTVTLESGLNYLGLGLPIPAASFGAMLREGAAVIQSQWWLAVFPGFALVLAVLACNAAGDALRDAFAPKQVHA